MSNLVTNSISVSAAQDGTYSPATLYQTSDSGADFKLLLTSMLLEQLGNPLTGESSSSTDLSSIISLLMGTLGGSTSLQDLLGSFVNPVEDLTQAARLQINQFDAETQIGGDGINSNCGPTSLVMALRGLGLTLPGEASLDKSGEVIELARRTMVNDSSRDGVTASGKRSEQEQNYFTDFDDLMRGARAAGASARMIGENASSILTALKSGARVVVSGTFVGKANLPWTGDRGSDNHSAPGNATQHIVTVSGYNQQTGKFIVNDPARRTPIEVSGEQLENFMAGNAGAMAVQRG